MMPKSGGMFYRQANRIAPFAGRGLGRPPRSHSKGRGGPIGCLRVNIAALFILYVGCP